MLSYIDQCLIAILQKPYNKFETKFWHQKDLWKSCPLNGACSARIVVFTHISVKPNDLDIITTECMAYKAKP